MPPKTRRRQRQPQTIKAQPVISLKQSTETVQVLLFGALSTLLWLRGLFPEEAYDHVNINEKQPFQYDAFTSGKDHTAGQMDDLSTVRLLRKGRSARIDKFFRIIEDGVFDALKKKVLKSVQISLFADANDQGTILEAYTFSVTYSESPDTDAQISGIQFHSQGASTTRSEQTNLTSFVHQVEMQIEKLDLNRLPNGVHMTAHLCYVQDCDEDYEPPNFERVEENVVSFPAGSGWHKEETALGSMTGAFHEIALEASYLSHEDGHNKRLSIGKGAETTVQTRRFPKAISPTRLDVPGGGTTGYPAVATPKPALQRDPAYTTPGGSSTSTQSNDLPPRSPRTAYRPAIDADLDLETSATPLSRRPGAASLRQITRTMDNSQQFSSQLSDALVGSTQWREDMQMRDDLRRIDDPEPGQQFSVATQPAFEFSHEQQRGRHHGQSGEPLSTATQEAPNPMRPKNASDEQAESDWVRCQCGFVGLDAKIKCHGCQTLQHPQCYGYFGHNDPRRAPRHFCYECLLGDSEPGLLTILQNASMLRQLVHIILHDEVFEKTDVLNSLASYGVDEAKAKVLIGLAVEKGYINAPRLTTRSSQGEVERLRMAAMYHGRKGVETLLQLFNPVSGIERYYDASYVQAVKQADSLLLAKSCYPLLSACRPFKTEKPKRVQANTYMVTPQPTSMMKDRVRKSLEPVDGGEVDNTQGPLEQVNLVPNKKARAEMPPALVPRRTPRRSTRDVMAKLKLSPFNTSQEPTPGRRVKH